MSNKGKIAYQNIAIPKQLNQVIWEAQKKAAQHKKSKYWHKIITVTAACTLLFICANITPIYALAADIPVIGSIIRILHIGEGGVINDGISVESSGDGSNIKIFFSRDDQAVADAPVYTLEKMSAPHRLIINLHGVRNFDYETIEADLSQSPFVEDVYRNIILDDSAISFIVVLAANADYNVTEYANPGYLEFNFYPADKAVKGQEVFFLRSETMELGEDLAQICDMYWAQGCTPLKIREGQYIAVIGEYTTQEEAENALAALQEDYGDQAKFQVDKCPADEIPHN